MKLVNFFHVKTAFYGLGSRNWTRNRYLSKVGTGTVIKSYGFATLSKTERVTDGS
jgi:hypothetical protein